MKVFKYIIVASFIVVTFGASQLSFAAELPGKVALAKSSDSRIQTFAEKMVTIYGVIVGKLEDQADRIGKTITRLDQDTDADLVDAIDQLAVARIKIRIARKSVNDLGNTISAILKRGGSPRIELKEIREEISDVRDNIADANNTLQYTVVIIKEEFGLGEEDTETSTSTATTTAQ